MRKLILTLALTLAANEAVAQEWTAEQQGLIDHVESCWDAWIEALDDQTPAQWEEACPGDEQAHYWWTEEGSPNLREEVRRNWHVIREIDDDWVSLRPIYVDIFGDVGIIHMYGLWRANIPDGTAITEYKRTEVFQRRDSEWVFVGGQSSPASPADAAPYRR